MAFGVIIDFLGRRKKELQTDWEQASDQEIIHAYQKSNDVELISVLMNRYHDLILARTFNYLKDEIETEDFVSDLYLKLAEKLKKIAEIQDVKSWLRRLITNMLIDQSRKKQHHQGYVQQLAEGEDFPFERMALQMDAERLAWAIEQLRPLPRMYVMLHFFGGKQNQEIAQETELEMNQVRGARNSALKKLKELLGESFENYFQQE